MEGRYLTAKQLNRRVLNFLQKLYRLQDEAKNLVEMIEDYAWNGEDTTPNIYNYDEYTYYFKQIQIVLDDLSNFDLEDSIEGDRY